MNKIHKKFYLLGHGWANKYYWFDIVEDFPPGKGNFEDRIKKSQLTFTKQSGTTPIDVHGSTIAFYFYSKKFVEFLKKSSIKNFKAYKIKFVPEMSKIGDYYYIDFKEVLPARRKGDDVTFYARDWKSQQVFTIKGTRMVIVTEELKKAIEKEQLKNFQFEEIKSA